MKPPAQHTSAWHGTWIDLTLAGLTFAWLFTQALIERAM